MQAPITVYEKPTCTTCRKANALLQEMGFDFDKVNYYVDALSATKLRELIKKMGINARDLLRTSEPMYRELGLGTSQHTEEELIELMASHPDLIQRPIVERGSKAVLGRPVENIRQLLG
jgi:arsenate reductase